ERRNPIARKAAELFDADLALVGLRSESQDHLVIRAGYQLHDDEVGQRLELGEGALGLAAERREGVLANDYATWPGRLQRRLTLKPREPLRATIAYPLLVRGEAIGALSVAYLAKDRQFNSEDVDRLATLAAPGALAIEHSRLYDQLASRVRRPPSRDVRPPARPACAPPASRLTSTRSPTCPRRRATFTRSSRSSSIFC